MDGAAMEDLLGQRAQGFCGHAHFVGLVFQCQGGAVSTMLR